MCRFGEFRALFSGIEQSMPIQGQEERNGRTIGEGNNRFKTDAGGIARIELKRACPHIWREISIGMNEENACRSITRPQISGYRDSPF